MMNEGTIINKETIFEGYKAFGKDYPISLSMGLQEVKDYMGEIKYLIYIQSFSDGEPWNNFTVSFGEFIGSPLLVYINVNNNGNIEEFLTSNNLAIKSRFKKQSGFVTYPAYMLNPGVVKAYLGDEDWNKYMKCFDYELYDEDEAEDTPKIEDNLPCIEELQETYDSVYKYMNPSEATN